MQFPCFTVDMDCLHLSLCRYRAVHSNVKYSVHVRGSQRRDSRFSSRILLPDVNEDVYDS